MERKSVALRHQKEVINRMVAVCRDQWGMIVAHEMGGGKTLTALMLLRNYPRSQHVIVCPDFLKNLYDEESIKYFGTPLKPGTLVFDYAEFEKFVLRDGDRLKDAILIFDEAHYLSPLIFYLSPRDKNTMFDTLTRYPRKCILMTGTPMYDSVDDLRLLVNIAAGKEVLPFRQTDFLEQFTVPRPFRVGFFTYFLPGVQQFSEKTMIGSVAGSFIPALNKSNKLGNATAISGGLWYVSTIMTLVSKIYRFDNPMFLRKYNIDKLTKALSPYMSLYKMKHGSLGIPQTSTKEVFLTYTMAQTNLWTRMMYNKLTDEDLYMLGLRNTDTGKLSLVDAYNSEFDIEQYKEWGRMISNTAPKGSSPSKFEACFANMLANSPFPNRPDFAVVYSDFEKGFQGFVEFLAHKSKGGSRFTYGTLLKEHGQEERQRTLRDFASGDLNVLVLGPGIYEGISIFRASSFHILDMPMHYKDMTQLRGRVVRIHSHEGLPPSRQKVTYYHYVAVLDLADVDSASFGEKVKVFLEKQVKDVLRWKEMWNLYIKTKSYKFTGFLDYKPTIHSTVTPEFAAYMNHQPLTELSRDLLSKLRDETLVLPRMQCCPTYDVDGASEDCLLHQIGTPCSEMDL